MLWALRRKTRRISQYLISGLGFELLTSRIQTVVPQCAVINQAAKLCLKSAYCMPRSVLFMHMTTIFRPASEVLNWYKHIPSLIFYVAVNYSYWPLCSTGFDCKIQYRVHKTFIGRKNKYLLGYCFLLIYFYRVCNISWRYGLKFLIFYRPVPTTSSVTNLRQTQLILLFDAF
jgi:hypothetical protein